MYRNMSAEALGVSGRQSELIELALTYGFRGVDVDMPDLLKRAETSSLDQAVRFLISSKLLVGSFELPINWQADEVTYNKDCTQLDRIVEIASSIGATRCFTQIQPGSDELPYHENFETARKRLGAIAERLAERDIQLGLGLLAAPGHRAERNFQFIHQFEELLTLLKSVSARNVGLALDTWNWRLGGGSLDQLEQLDAHRVVMVQLADIPADADWNTIDDTQRILPASDPVVDNAGVLRLLAEKGYDGPVTLCPHPDAFSGMTRDAIVQQTSQTLDDLWEAAGIQREGDLAAEPAEGASQS